MLITRILFSAVCRLLFTHHTLEQVVVGAIVGFFMAILWYVKTIHLHVYVRCACCMCRAVCRVLRVVWF